MENNTKLPPELVEKIGNVKQSIGDGYYRSVNEEFGSKAIEEIAQIAVDYAEELIKPVIETLESHCYNDESDRISEAYDSGLELAISMLQQLLKKHEDGK